MLTRKRSFIEPFCNLVLASVCSILQNVCEEDRTKKDKNTS